MPFNLNEPVFRLPYKKILSLVPAVGPGAGTVAGSGDARDGSPSAPSSSSAQSSDGSSLDAFEVEATERIDMKTGNRNIPYVWHTGRFTFRFALRYAALKDVLDQISELHALSQDGSPDGAAELGRIIESHEDSVEFSPGWLMDDSEDIQVQLKASRVTPLCWHPGRVVVSPLRVYFLPFNIVSSAPMVAYPLKNVVSIHKRTHQLQDIGVELFFSDNDSVYFAFNGKEERDKFHASVVQQPALYVKVEKPLHQRREDWLNGKLSNYDYLMFLNRQANRSFNDLTQYPIFPWILSDYESTSLDLNSRAVYRDLKKPIGALDSKRLKGFLHRYHEMKMTYADLHCQGARRTEYADIPFMFGCHYSTPGYVVYYLLRKNPQLMLKLQNGRFDSPDRLLYNIKHMWQSVLTLSTDLKELIPEFYSSSADFLLNKEGLDFGHTQSGDAVNNVVLPPWANDVDDFQKKMKEALESTYVSRNLHHWIDLIFGFKQRGIAAERASNVFHHLTYDDAAQACLSLETDARRLKALRDQIREFGRTPRQLFTKSHPSKRMRYIALARIGSRVMSFLGNVSLSIHLPLAKRMSVKKALDVILVKETSDKGLALKWLQITARTTCKKLNLKKSQRQVGLLIEGIRSNKAQKQVSSLKLVQLLTNYKPNIDVLVHADVLDPLVEALFSVDTDVVDAALDLVVILCNEERNFMGNSNVSALAALSKHLKNDLEHLQYKAARAIIELGKFKANRKYIIELDGIVLMHTIIVKKQKSRITVSTLNALAIVSTDVQALDKIIELHLPKEVVELCQYPEPRIQNAATCCLSAFCVHDILKLEIARLGGLGILCSSGKSFRIFDAMRFSPPLACFPSAHHRAAHSWGSPESLMPSIESADARHERSWRPRSRSLLSGRPRPQVGISRAQLALCGHVCDRYDGPRGGSLVSDFHVQFGQSGRPEARRAGLLSSCEKGGGQVLVRSCGVAGLAQAHQRQRKGSAVEDSST